MLKNSSVSAEAVGGANGFWKGSAQVLLQASAQQNPAAEDPQPPACVGWATAAVRQKQGPKTWSTPATQTAANGQCAPDLADYKPAAEVLTAAPIGPDDSQVVFKRPNRPKVEVSDSLRLLLQTTAAAQPVLTPCEQAIAKGAIASIGIKATEAQVVLKKRPLHSAAAAAPDQPSNAQLPTPVNQQGASALPDQGLKRVATQPAVSAMPALLKRPKLATQMKPPASKPTTAQGKAAGVKVKAQAAGKMPAAAKTGADAKVAAKPAPAKRTVQATDLAKTQAANVPTATMPAATGQAVSTAAASNAAPAGAAAPAKTPRQRKKADDVDLADVERKIKEKFAARKLQDLSVPELKCFLKAHKLPVGGKKSDLISRIEPVLAKS